MIKYFIYLIVAYQALLFLYYIFRFIYRHFLIKKLNLIERYGKNSYVIITGASSGQGYHFAKEFAKEGFNLFLIGSIRTKKVINEIKTKHPNINIIFIEKDFRKAHHPNFFYNIKESINNINGNISILVNNVAYRTAWKPYHKMPEQLINDSITVGTIVQSQLTRIVLPYFIKRKQKSAILNITAQCIIPTYLFGEILGNEISVPYLSVYEASNAFGYFQANSLLNEYKKYNYKIDILNVTPGAVLTKNTKYLKNIIFNVDVDKFVNNIMKQIGHYSGTCYGYWGHEFSIFLMNIFPFMKQYFLDKTGETIANDFMIKPFKKY